MNRRDGTSEINNQNSIILYPFYFLLGLSIGCTSESRGHENTVDIVLTGQLPRGSSGEEKERD